MGGCIISQFIFVYVFNIVLAQKTELRFCSIYAIIIRFTGTLLIFSCP